MNGDNKELIISKHWIVFLGTSLSIIVKTIFLIVLFRVINSVLPFADRIREASGLLITLIVIIFTIKDFAKVTREYRTEKLIIKNDYELIGKVRFHSLMETDINTTIDSIFRIAISSSSFGKLFQCRDLLIEFSENEGFLLKNVVNTDKFEELLTEKFNIERKDGFIYVSNNVVQEDINEQNVDYINEENDAPTELQEQEKGSSFLLYILKRVVGIILGLLKSILNLFIMLVQNPLGFLKTVGIYFAIIIAVLIFITTKLTDWGWDKYIDAFFQKIFPGL